MAENEGVETVWVSRMQLVHRDEQVGDRWRFFTQSKIHDGEITLAMGECSVLESGALAPTFVIDKRQWMAGRAVRVAIGEQSTERRESLTELVLGAALGAYRSRFGAYPEHLPGRLAADNLKHFREEALRLQDQVGLGLSVTECYIEAVRRISFGRSRAAHGYTEFEVVCSDASKVVYRAGPPETLRYFPETIDIVATRKP